MPVDAEISETFREFRDDIKGLALAISRVEVKLAEQTGRDKELEALKIELKETKATVNDLKQFKGWFAGVAAGLSLIGGSAGHLITKLFDSTPAPTEQHASDHVEKH